MGCSSSAPRDGKASARRWSWLGSSRQTADGEPLGMATAQLLDRAPPAEAASRRAAVAAALRGRPPKPPTAPKAAPNTRANTSSAARRRSTSHDVRLASGKCTPLPPHHRASTDSSWDWMAAGGGSGGGGSWGPGRPVQRLGPLQTPASADSIRALSMPGSGFMPRQRDASLFGVTDKRRPAPLRETRRIRTASLVGVVLINQYMVISFLGQGSSGRVYLCLDIHDSRLYAVKVLVKEDLALRSGRQGSGGAGPLLDLHREIAVMRTLRHRNIVSLHEVVEDEAQMLLVMEFMQGGPVLPRAALAAGARIPEDLARLYFRDMCKAVDYLHHRKIVHGDIKPDNLLMTASGAVTLSDFGCATRGGGLQSRCSGTPAFLAPEMMVPDARYRGRPTDVYALGACLYTFVFGKIPFSASSIHELFRIVLSQPLEFPAAPAVSPQLKDLLTQMLHKDPQARISLRGVMAHPWVTCGGTASLRTVRELVDEEAASNGEGTFGGGGGSMLGSNSVLGSGGGRHGGRSGRHLPDMMQTMNVVDVLPQDFLPLLLPAEVRVKAFEPGDYLMFQDDPADCLMFILEGQAEVLMWVPRAAGEDAGKVMPAVWSDDSLAPEALHSGSFQRRAPPVGDSSRGAAGSRRPPLFIPPGLAHEVVKAREYTGTLLRGPREFLVAVRGPGQVVGEMALLDMLAAAAGGTGDASPGSGRAGNATASGSGSPSDRAASGSGHRADPGGADHWSSVAGAAAGAQAIPGRRCASVRAASSMSVAVVSVDHFCRVCMAHSEVHQQVREGCWARRSEGVVLASLVRLASLHESLRAVLANQATPLSRRASADTHRWQI